MVEHAFYLIGLLLAIGGMVIIDFRWRLAFFDQPKRTILTMATSMLLFIAWDSSGIVWHIFRYGKSRYSLHFLLAPNFPVEEIFFLYLLCYTSLIIYRFIDVHLSNN